MVHSRHRMETVYSNPSQESHSARDAPCACCTVRYAYIRPQNCGEEYENELPQTAIPRRYLISNEALENCNRGDSPMPTFRNFPGNIWMSRQNRTGLPGPAPHSSGNGSTGPGVPGPVVQQAQQYLEENIKAWMQPSSSQSTSREDMVPLPLTHTASPAEPHSASHHFRQPSGGGLGLGSQSSITRQALQDHNLAFQQSRTSPPVPPHAPGYLSRAAPPPQPPPLTSPSSGYSDSYFALSLTGACDTSGGQISSSKAINFPHSLSFGGCSNHSLLQGTSYSSPCGNSNFGSAQPSAAASFFARAAQRLNLSTKKKRRLQHPSDPERPVFQTNFCEILKSHPPPIPPNLLRNTGRKETGGIGKVKVMLRMSPSNDVSSSDASYMSVDGRKKQITLYDPTVCGGTGQDHTGERHTSIAAPKMFAFDAVFSPDDNQAEVCSSSLCDVISSVVGGADGCLFAYGHSKLGKTSTMVGSNNSAQELGVIPCAIWWLYRAINEHKHRTGARFSVRVSAVEVSGKTEELRDLLADYAAGTEGSGSSPGVYLRDDPVFGTQLMNQSELRAPTAERAAFLLDAALAARTQDGDDDAKNAHFLFTLHVYQYRVEKGGRGGVAGGRSRLHLFDLGSCEKMSKSRDGVAGGCLSLSALGNVILALFNGQKHVPYKESKLTQLLREAVGSVTCRAAMIAHVSTAPARYPETLATLQLASRIHRLRRKKLKFLPSADIGNEEKVCRPFVKIHAVGEDGGVKSGSSDPDYTSSSEQSCDTVIFVGNGRGTPLPNGSMTRQSTISPLASEIRPSNLSPLPNKKQSYKTNYNQSSQQNKSVSAIAASSNSVKEERSTDSPSKSAFIASEQSRLVGISGVSSSASPKKKTSLSSSVASPKHQKLESSTSSNVNSGHSPKMTKHAGLDYSNDIGIKNKLAAEIFTKGSPAKSAKSGSADLLQKIAPTLNSAPGSPQSLRKSKRSHKQEHSSPLSSSQPQSPANKPITKEPKLASDETWIDGPRFVKPKFDSRTLHQLQKEKWVDGPGLYGYMDVQKETMIRKWVEDHSRVVPEEQRGTTKEVWIDFPPNTDDKGVAINSKTKNSTHADDQVGISLRAGSSTEDLKKESRTKIYIPSPNKIQVEVETHHYAKPNLPQHKHSRGNKDFCNSSKTRDKLGNEIADPVPTNHGNENSVTGDTSADAYRFAECHTSDENSNSSVDFNDNDSDDLSNKLRCISEEADSTFTDGSIYHATGTNGDDQNAEDACDMVDSSIQVTEEDILSSCGWTLEMNQYQPLYGNLGDYNGVEHPLRVLSAEDLNLASSFTDSRAVSVDFDSMSVPETWTGVAEELDPDLTWRLLRGSSLSKYGPGRDVTSSKNMNDNNGFKIMAKSETLNAKLERLSRLREIFEKKESHRENFQPLRFPERLAELSSKENCFFMSNKFHHSADSSLEELRENDVNSIHSEPAELDIDKMDFQFNVKPMNGLRLEAFYNKICKIPRFPERTSQFGKPTQVVPPIVKQQKNYIRFPISDLKSLKESLKNSREKLKDENSINLSPVSIRKRWSASFRKPDGASDSEMNKHPSVTDLTSKSCSSSEVPLPQTNCNAPLNDSNKSPTVSMEQLKRRSLVEIIQEQRCQVYSEGLNSPNTTSQTHHPSKHGCTHRTSKSTKVITEQITNVIRNIEVAELRNDNSSHKKHQKKNGSPKLPVRGSASNGNGRNGYLSRSAKAGHQQLASKINPSSTTSTTPNSSPQHHAKPSDSSIHSQSGVSSSVSWTVLQTGHLVNAPYTNPMHSYTDCDNSSLKSHILSRSTSTPTSPFLVDEASWTNTDFVTKAGTYVRCTSTATPTVTTTLLTPSSNKKGTKWVTRTSSSGHGSDSSALSTDMKETKELMGTLPKGQTQFSGTSSGYESMPRDSEGTPLSSSSHESSSEVGGKRDTRGRKGTRKKSQGSGKRSRSVPARPALTNSPSWQPLPTPVDVQPHVRGRGRLVRDLHDPSLWKSEEDVCCTSLLCCRLLDFY